MAGYIGSKTSVSVVSPVTDSRYVNVTGDTMTGALGIQGATNSDVFKVGTAGTHLTVQTNDAVGEVKLKVQDDSGNNYWKYITFHTEGGSGTLERMRIDPQGRVTMPYQPAFTLNFSLTSYTSGSSISYLSSSTMTTPSTVVNTGNHWNTTTGLFTAPVSGNYQFFYYASNDGPTSGTAISLEKNNVILGQHMYLYTNIGYITGGVTAVVPLSAGDTVRFGYRDFQASGERLYTGFFGGHLIG